MIIIMVKFGPPPECAVHGDFEDSPALQAMVVDAQTAAVPLSAWDDSMERHGTIEWITARRGVLQRL